MSYNIMRDAFVAHMTRMFQLLGDTPDTAAAEAKTVMAFEMKLAAASKTPVELRDPQANYHKLTPAQLAALTRYAQCMRRHDIDMLDPTPSGQLNLGTVPGITSNFGRYSPQFRSADAACRHLLPAGVHDNGTGP